MRKSLIIGAALSLAFSGIFPTDAAAQVPGNPFAIDGVVTDFENSGVSGGYTVPPCDPPAVGGALTGPAPQACKQADPNGNAQELGPKNSNTTKVAVVHNAALPMLNTTSPTAQVTGGPGGSRARSSP
jgi:hypothetical protein